MRLGKDTVTGEERVADEVRKQRIDLDDDGSRWAVPTRSSSSERVMASSVVGPEVSRPTASRPDPGRLVVRS